MGGIVPSCGETRAAGPWCAQVAELVDALASGASAPKGRGSSSLLLGTKGTPKGRQKAYHWIVIDGTGMNSQISLHENDLPDAVQFSSAVAVDSETMGLKTGRDRLCVLQLSGGDGDAHLVRFRPASYDAPNLRRLFADPALVKIFHYARFDMAAIFHHLDVMPAPVYCTKIASRLARTYSGRHGLKDVIRDMLAIDISKQPQSSDWGADRLSKAQLRYAAGDVLYLHAIREKCDAILARENRAGLAQACFDFLAARVRLDLAGWDDDDIFSH